MKKTASSLAALALAISAGSALAADLPRYKAPPPPPPPPPPLWTGFYVGLNAGYTFNDSTLVNTTAAPIFANAGLGNSGPASLASALAANSSIGVRSDGFIGGGQVGYNWQFWNGSAVAGVEADIQGIAGSSNRAAVATVAGAPGLPEVYVSTTQVSKRLDYIGTVRGRLGWLFTPTLLVYGTGGLAYGGVNLNTSVVQSLVPPAATANPFFTGTSFADTRVGWTAGGGLEWMFWPNWSAKVEYLYYDLGTVSTAAGLFQVNNAGTPFIGSALQTNARFNGHIIRAGLNYHFNWAPAPVVAKF